jgi:hypothetical protein
MLVNAVNWVAGRCAVVLGSAAMRPHLARAFQSVDFFPRRLQSHRVVRKVRQAMQVTINAVLMNVATGRDSPIPLTSTTYAARQAGHLGIRTSTMPGNAHRPVPVIGTDLWHRRGGGFMII